MYRHDNYFEFQADCTFDLGQLMGACFKDVVLTKMNDIRRDAGWLQTLNRAQKYLPITKKYFPQYIQKLEGYAKGAGVDFMELWTISLQDDLAYYRAEHCTSIITNGGMLVAHNEDWSNDAKDDLCVIKKTVGDLTILELHYITSLGGTAISINSYGYIQCINSLSHTDWQIGVPRNVMARFMSETKDPVKNFERLKSTPRSTGYNYNIVSPGGKLWSIESTALRQLLIEPTVPFIHTNHYLADELKPYDEGHSRSSSARYAYAKEHVRQNMSVSDIEGIMSNTSRGSTLSIFNEDTVGRMIVDVQSRVAKIWLKRESDKGWINYSLDFGVYAASLA